MEGFEFGLGEVEGVLVEEEEAIDWRDEVEGGGDEVGDGLGEDGGELEAVGDTEEGEAL